MTIQTKLCFLLVALMLIVIQSKYTVAADDKVPQKQNKSVSGKSPAKPTDRNDPTSSQTASRPKQVANADAEQEEVEYGPPYDAIPSQSFFTNNNPFASKESECYSLIDAQYPIFADMCGALPQIRYSLPNSFGHFERWQIAQVLNAMLASAPAPSNNPTCNRSLRLLICPLLFQPCMKSQETKIIRPCQPFCRAVKSQCVAPSLDFLPCDFLPPTSEICPVYPSPYGSASSLYGQQMQSSSSLSPKQEAAIAAYLAHQHAMTFASSQSGSPLQGLSPSTIPYSAIYGTTSPSSQQFTIPATLPPTFGITSNFGLPSVAPPGFGQNQAKSLYDGQWPYQQHLNQQQMIDISTPIFVNMPFLPRLKQNQ